jgi:hypothetical protein
MTNWEQMTDIDRMAVQIENLRSAWAQEVLVLERARLEASDAQGAVVMATTKLARAVEKANKHSALADRIERDYLDAKAAYERMEGKTNES